MGGARLRIVGTGEPSGAIAGRLVAYRDSPGFEDGRRTNMAESERARQLKQYAERLAELRRYL